MYKQYYIIQDGAQKGPFGVEQLRELALTRETFVWTPGMQDWQKAGNIPELGFLFGIPEEEESAFGGYARPEEPAPYRSTQSQYNTWNQNTAPIPHTNWLPWAIVGTIAGALFSCIGMIFGIIGITKASKANRFYMEGFEEMGRNANSTARTMTIIALAFAAVGIILTIIGVPAMIMENMQELQNLNQF